MQKIINYIDEHCSVIGTPRKEELKKMVKDEFIDIEDKLEIAENAYKKLKERHISNNSETTTSAFKLKGVHATLRNQMVIDQLNETFPNIPIEELGKFIEQYKK